MVVSLPLVTNIQTTPKATQVIVGDPTPPYVPSFILPLSTRDYPHGMPTTMMVGLQIHASKFADNTMAIVSPLSLHLALESSISILG